ncbi:hypothetical protein ACJX0J_012710, partial [Zea mays]
GSMNGLANRDLFGEKDEPVIVVGLAKSEFYFMLVLCGVISNSMLLMSCSIMTLGKDPTSTSNSDSICCHTNICTSRGRYRRSHHGMRSCNVNSSSTLYKLPRLWCPTRWGRRLRGPM